ncbi:hypothetical protein LSCM1_01615 [Leishmania martiniquensis]|uniref:Uncharacterized protein n=1 Tax=Leishmania martiniquensis TaxID=1580590 RepID=A0A836FY79_9TRYP|nr:hypothetical protein LSCM1_01615 [Leishmania martiniquensis]
MAAETKADAARQVKALEEYEESVSIVRRVQRERDVVARELADLAARRAEVHALEAELVEVHKALGAARASRAAEADARPCVLMSEGTHGESADVCKGLADDDEFALAKCIVGEELDKIIDELAAATSELSEAEDVLIEEADRAALALRRCDSEMKLRFERLMDRFASLMDVESRLAMRSASIFSECSPRLRN